MNKGAIIRLIVLLVVLLNQLLSMSGKSPLPFSNEEIEQGVTAVVTTVVSLWVYWKNNSFSPEARKADEYMKELKNNK